MAITTVEFEAVLREIAPALTGGWIQKIGEPMPDVLLFDIRIPGHTLRLLISVDPDQARLHLVTSSHPNPSVPPPFCRFLRARMLGARIDRIRQVQGDRIVRLDLTSGSGTWGLVAELFGRQPDVLVTDEAEQVIATYRRAAPRMRRPYSAPLRPLKHPAAPPPSSASPTDGHPAFPVSIELEERYGRREQAMTTRRLTAAREAFLRKILKKQHRLLTALNGDLAKAARYESYARYGELLKGALDRVHKGHTAVTLVDYFDGRLPELTIPLDPAKTPRGNMEAYFSKHKKFLTARKEIVPRIETIQRELRDVETELEEIKQGRWQPTRPIPHIPYKARGPSGQRSSGLKPERSGPFRRFISADSIPIYVGRNARENDELTFGFGKSDDLWLHAQGVPGSHVIVRLEKGSDAPADTLQDAAMLALLYSDLKKSGRGDVIYTRRKWVRKPKGAAPGSVLVTQEKTLFIRLDKARLEALKHRSV